MPFSIKELKSITKGFIDHWSLIRLYIIDKIIVFKTWNTTLKVESSNQCETVIVQVSELKQIEWNPLGIK